MSRAITLYLSHHCMSGEWGQRTCPSSLAELLIQSNGTLGPVLKELHPRASTTLELDLDGEILDFVLMLSRDEAFGGLGKG